MSKKQQQSNKLFSDLVNKKFGRLIALSCVEVKRYACGQKDYLWECKCECGNLTKVWRKCLITGNTKSCGCHHKSILKKKTIDLKGKRFGRLLVIENTERKVCREYYWRCKCDCGNIKDIAGNSLRSGKSKSCGCRQGQFIHGKWGKPGYKQFYLSDPIKRLKHNVSKTVRNALKSRDISKNRSKTFEHLPYTAEQLKEHLEYLWEPWMNWDNYGGTATKKKRKTWQIDHIVPQKDFPYESLDDPLFLECWDLSNLRPLETIKNIRKGSKYET